MPELIRCPVCEATLRVPLTLLGKKVSCPKCRKIFTAARQEVEELEEIDEGIRTTPTAPVSKSVPASYRISEEGNRDEAEYEESAEEEQEDLPRPRRRRRRKRNRPSGAGPVMGPAIALLVVGGIGIFAAFAYLIMQLFNIGNFSHMPQYRSSAYQSGQLMGMICGVIWGVVGLLWSLAVMRGALNMMNLRDYDSAKQACILALVPGNCVCLLSLPFGIWGLVVLNNPRVRSSFV